MTEAQAERTRVLAKALGPFLVLIAVIIFGRYETLTAVLPTFTREAPLILVTGVFTMLFGCLMFALHHHWSSLAAITVSVLSLIFIVRGLTLALTPDLVMDVAEHVTRTPIIMLGLTTIAGFVGAWLTFVGWFAKTV